MSDSNNRDSITLEQIQAWAKEIEDTNPIYLYLETDTLKIYIQRSENMDWSYGIGAKSEHLYAYESSTSFHRSRSEMANDLLRAMSEMNARIAEETKKELARLAKRQEHWQRVLDDIAANARDTDE